MTKEERALKKRVAALEAREQERARAEKVQDALYRIAEAASSVEDLPTFYAAMHEIVGDLMYAENAYIALYDEERQAINFPYYGRQRRGPGGRRAQLRRLAGRPARRGWPDARGHRRPVVPARPGP